MVSLTLLKKLAQRGMAADVLEQSSIQTVL